MFSPGGCCSLSVCCRRNVTAEGTDRCEGLNLTCCKSHTHTHTYKHAHTHRGETVCVPMHALGQSLLSDADLPPGFSPLSTVRCRSVLLPCKTKRMIEAVCVFVRAAGIVTGQQCWLWLVSWYGEYSGRGQCIVLS